MELRCTCGTVASISVTPEARGRWLFCICPGCGCRLGGRAEESPRPAERIDCEACGKRHWDFGGCPTDEPAEERVYTREMFEDGLRRPLVRIEDS